MDKKKIIIWFFIVIFIAGLLWFGILFVRKIYPVKSPVGRQPSAEFDRVNTTTGDQAPSDTEIAKIKAMNAAVENVLKNDADLDGLTDAEEKALGTNPNLSDTDKDGLLDKVEVEIYKTDPKKADTDGDGYNDGIEVRRGFNPLGPGKLK